MHEGQLSANNQSEMVDLLLHGAAGLTFPEPCAMLQGCMWLLLALGLVCVAFPSAGGTLRYT